LDEGLGGGSACGGDGHGSCFVLLPCWFFYV